MLNAHTGARLVNETLINFEREVALGPTFAAKLLGVSYSIYAQYRSGRRPLQTYHRNHVRVLLRLSKRDLALTIKEHVYGQSING